MREVHFHRLAVDELRGAMQWYAQRSVAARDRFRAAIFEAVERIAANPELPSPLVAHYRYVRPRRFPYLIVYEIRSDGTPFVVAVAHASRRPGYWRKRGGAT
ncbi:MAG: type II toxin-antitoxin system RelE/ParE family toxin [Pirellulales bacterium]|nr:type II toxin-antitoxin system RelE/ParE family toxin [Pirellulales bacterium]